MKVSFDFDGCLTRRSMQKLAKTLVQKGHDVWIVTSRSDTKASNSDIYRMAKKLGIQNIHFCCDWKVGFFENNDFDYHIDDYWHEITEINNKTNTIAFPCDIALYFKEIEL